MSKKRLTKTRYRVYEIRIPITRIIIQNYQDAFSPYKNPLRVLRKGSKRIEFFFSKVTDCNLTNFLWKLSNFSEKFFSTTIPGECFC